jgi:hypothetical protein
MSAPSGGGGPPQVVVPGLGWVDVAARVITTVGFPVVVAAALLWFVLTRFESHMDTITTRMEKNATSLEAFTTELKAQTGELRAQTQLLEEEGRQMARMAADAARLVDMRRGEAERRPSKEPPP